jgi:hypothetical protein
MQIIATLALLLATGMASHYGFEVLDDLSAYLGWDD